jgi:hypothetical protein
MNRLFQVAILVGVGTLPMNAAQAAGGHFDVDDAAVLEPGRCQVETWLTRSPGALTTAHLGPSCRIGPVELGFNVDRFKAQAVGGSTLGPQLKWVADPVINRLNAGVVAALGLKAQGDARTSRTLYFPLTWAPHDSFAVNAIIGADWVAGNRGTRRLGIAGEWSAGGQATVIAERFGAGGEWVSRLGLRVSLGDSLSLDLSAARADLQTRRLFAIGLNHEFAR